MGVRMASDERGARDITQDSKALFELLYQTREWLNKHHYYPMDAKVALQWVYALLERGSDDRWGSILDTMQQEQQTLKHRIGALEEVVEQLGAARGGESPDHA
jgi:hypothetical protein